METYKFIDLFSGIGGFHQALASFADCVMASEIDEKCCEIYTKNYGIQPRGNIQDIQVESVPNFDIIAGGFPCQSFSKAGKREGFDDKKGRGNLFFDICRLAEYTKPKYMILENVKNLRSHDSGNTWKTIREKIDEMGYFTYDEPITLNALFFGVPQSRERVIILCKRKDLGELQKLPVINNTCIQNTSIENIIDDESLHSKYKITGKMKVVEEVWNDYLNILHTNNIDVPKIPIWTDWWDCEGEGTSVTKRDPNKSDSENDEIIRKKKDDFYKKYKNWIDKNREFYTKNKNILEPWLQRSRAKSLWKGAVRKLEWQAGDEKLTMNQVLWSARGSGVRVKKINYSPTLVAMASMIPVYGPLSKTLSPRECARLQSFGENTILHEDDKTSYKQFGNAVNVKMINKCARFLIFNEPLFEIIQL
tara:strand:+ start:227 stop:1489 length:1263 start_codon:yes stop_codon:yes gene_type:complete